MAIFPPRPVGDSPPAGAPAPSRPATTIPTPASRALSASLSPSRKEYSLQFTGGRPR